MASSMLLTVPDFAEKINAVHEAGPGKKRFFLKVLVQSEAAKKYSQTADCEKAGRAYLEIYFLDFFISIS
ncbi:MAG: hypothetical protein ACTFAK_01710 [Candidatus Electronema sp. VV]